MNPTLGQGGTTLGGGTPMQAMAGGQSPLNQVSASSPQYAPSLQVPAQPQLPSPQNPMHVTQALARRGIATHPMTGLPIPPQPPMAQGGTAGMGQTPNPNKLPLNTQSNVIIDALVKHLERVNKQDQTPGRSDTQEVKTFDSEANRIRAEYEALNGLMKGDMAASAGRNPAEYDMSKYR